jgi:hypothetical protein
MSEKAHRPPAGEPWVWLTRELITSDAWHSARMNVRRFIDFLSLEHMRHGGQENGKLKAPYTQLEAYGVGARYLADTIREAETLGLVDCHRGGRRVATIYTLTWLPMHDGSPPSNRWRNYHDDKLHGRNEILPENRKVAPPAKGNVDRPNLPAKGRLDGPKSLPVKGRSFL